MHDYTKCPENIADDYRRCNTLRFGGQVETPSLRHDCRLLHPIRLKSFSVPSYQGGLPMTEDTKKFIAFVAAVAVVLSVLLLLFSAAWVGVEGK